MPASYTPQQKAAIQQFVGITTADKSSAAKVLRQYNWNVDAAVNSTNETSMNMDMQNMGLGASPRKGPPGATAISFEQEFMVFLNAGMAFLNAGKDASTDSEEEKVSINEVKSKWVSERDKEAVSSAPIPLALRNRPPKALQPAFFNGNPNANSAVRTTLNHTFDKYRDDPKEEPDEINVEGMQQLLGDLDISIEDIGALIFSELVSSPSLGKITREGFVDGFTNVNADTIPKMRDIIQKRRNVLSTDKSVFKNVYNHTFVLPLSGSQKALPLETAEELWGALFSPSGFEWRTASTDWLGLWLEFLKEKWGKSVNKDLWKQTLNFAEQTLKDESLSFWTEESSWPSVIDEFVEWVKVEKREGGGEDAMDVGE
ncbi:hypothetical protein MBLNU230_g0153t1 [Neophaeotheca triangularis]